MRNRKSGFTLLELAVVLVVVGLIVGGIFTSKGMIRSSQIQSALSDADAYKKNVMTFKDKYKYLPGDMPTATSFWGSLGAGCPCSSATSAQTLTCNGNGDGHIDNNYESTFAWQQLANANLITGGYSGESDHGVNVAVIGGNVPASKIAKGGFSIFYQPPLSATTGVLFAGTYGHIIMFGALPANGYSSAIGATTASVTSGPIISPTEAYAIDSKIDDGLPATGSIVVSPSYTSSAIVFGGCSR